MKSNIINMPQVLVPDEQKSDLLDKVLFNWSVCGEIPQLFVDEVSFHSGQLCLNRVKIDSAYRRLDDIIYGYSGGHYYRFKDLRLKANSYGYYIRVSVKGLVLDDCNMG